MAQIFYPVSHDEGRGMENLEFEVGQPEYLERKVNKLFLGNFGALASK